MFGAIRTVEQLLESVMSKEFKEKDYNPDAVRQQMLYLGDKKFYSTFKDIQKSKKNCYDEIKKLQKVKSR